MAGETNYPGALDTHSSGNPYGFAVQVDDLQTALNAAASSGAATLSVENTTNFPSRGSAWIGDDEFTWTGKNSTGFTGVSGLGSPHASGAIVAQVPSARNHNDLAAAVVALETKLGASTSTSGAGQVSPSTTVGHVLKVVSTSGQTGYGTIPTAGISTGGQIAKKQLDYLAASDLHNGSTLAGGVYIDLVTPQAFTVDDPNSLVHIHTRVGCIIGSATPGVITSRVQIDSTHNYMLGANRSVASLFDRPGIGSGTVVSTSLSTGAHTVTVQAASFTTGNSLWLRAASIAGEFLAIQVVEHKR